MKKLVMIVAVGIAALASQAASFSWKCTASRSGTISDYSGMALGEGYSAYLFDAATVTQSSLLEAVRAGGTLEENAIAGATGTTNSSGKIGEVSFSYGSEGNDYTFYFAILDTSNNQLLISTAKTGSAQAADSTSIGFQGDASTFSAATFGDASYGSAGWYSTATVPEPTSGLLLLLGVAGIALKRKCV